MSSISQSHSDATRANGANPNGRTHGITASRIIFKTPEECDEFDTLRADYATNLAPKGPIERDLAEQMIHASWRLRNVAVADAALYEKAGGDPLLSDDPAIEKKAALLHRYRTAAERAFQRAHKQLETLQNNRLYQEQFPNSSRPTARHWPTWNGFHAEPRPRLAAPSTTRSSRRCSPSSPK